ncbi:hypothetical protein B0H17DRAFT_1064551 [Mycena rosella]|uniref:Uncharacterized protein n=1 Tax=Mycena rosella TaxID=1033263 RepID=A0AAD7GII6_MYCRO|nr:hypothetical protein B0H17DRAFT_1064551 [Mycena rosella]
MAAHYLCCLPLRLGVLVISFLQFIASAFAAGLVSYFLVLDAQGKDSIDIPTRTKIVAIVVAVLYGLVALVSLTGFIGAIRKKESQVGMFSNLLRFFLVVQVAVVTAYFVLYFLDKDKFRKLCIGDSTDQKVIDVCNANDISLWALIVSAILPIICQAYGVYIVSSYVKKLHNENFLRQESFGFKGPGYMPVHEETHPLTHQATYPYADNSHSFGLNHHV